MHCIHTRISSVEPLGGVGGGMMVVLPPSWLQSWTLVSALVCHRI